MPWHIETCRILGNPRGGYNNRAMRRKLLSESGKLLSAQGIFMICNVLHIADHENALGSVGVWFPLEHKWCSSQ